MMVPPFHPFQDSLPHGSNSFPADVILSKAPGYGAADGVHRQERDHHHLELQVTLGTGKRLKTMEKS